MDSSLQLGEGPEPSETSHDTSLSADTLRPRRPPQHPYATRIKHPSGSNVSFSHDTEGGEDQQAQVRTDASTTTTTSTITILLLWGGTSYYHCYYYYYCYEYYYPTTVRKEDRHAPVHVQYNVYIYYYYYYYYC